MSRSMIERNREFYDVLAVDLPEFFRYPDIPTALTPATRSMFMAYVIGELVEFGNAKDVVSQADAMVDVLYFVLNIFLEMGLDPEELHKIVHETNMAKRWDDDDFHLDTSVVPPKLMKPMGWISPVYALSNYIDKIYSKLELEKK